MQKAITSTRFFLLLCCTLFGLTTAQLLAQSAGGIRGVIKGDDGAPLAYATVFIKQLNTGAASDAQGRYEVALAPGHYDVLFHFLGYETSSRTIDINGQYIDLNITLKTQALVLQSVTVRANKEDPAYTIMRKAIAKARYHTQQVDSFSARVYIKGKGKLKDYPWLAKKALEKEGITKDRLFITESVSEISYKRPNKFKEKVIAVYKQGNAQASPNAYIFGSLYEPEIAETVSPLSPKSFTYYRFEYLGSFKERGYEISKIKVTPRSKGDNVFEGIIFIVEDYWSIHSVDLKTTKLGINFDVKQIYSPIDEKAWMPVSQQFVVGGSVFGFDFEGQYLATVKDYKVFLNPALRNEITVVDDKLHKEEAKQIEKKYTKKNQNIEQRLAAGQEVSRKELNQMLKEYEKEEQKQQKEPDVVSETEYKVDSLAFKKDSTFWTEIRPAPLEVEEQRGYKKADSLGLIEKKKEEGDTLKKRGKRGFQVWDIITGDNYRLGKHSDFVIHTPYGGFNTVEGVNLIYRLGYVHRWVKRDSLHPERRARTSRLEISPVIRYSFAREKAIGLLRADFRNRNTRLTVEGGRYVQQYNSEIPIHHFVNTFTTLLMERNLMKIYERDFVDLRWRQQFNDRYTLTTQWSWMKRRELFNNNNYVLINYKKEAYTANAPVSNELASTAFPEHSAFLGSVLLEARPWLKYSVRDGRKERINESSPVFSLEYRKGFHNVLGSDVNYDMVDVGVRYGFKTGVVGRLDFNLHGGKFLNNDKMYFMDYKHFMGNRTPFMTTSLVGSYRLMDYYQYSTKDEYFTANVHYHFRKFLATRIPKLRMFGIRENVFVNYLKTPASQDYMEAGYSLDGILRIFRLEAAASFVQGNYQSYGFRIGIASNISVNFGD
ncbi:MAG: DUF5686 and carboxypeptidase regulatory-like domain-containing protein [Cyclobacteriaceae bacterium]|nr:DUF5686 and carboxypeptidase regulatory-like domain-containing protein [Cyclobacteriaceae bacterium]